MGVSIQAQLETEVFSTENWGDYYYLNQDFEKAITVLNQLRSSNAKNLTEQALSAWLHSIYYFHQQDWTQYRDNVLEAYLLRSQEVAFSLSSNTKHHTQTVFLIKDNRLQYIH